MPERKQQTTGHGSSHPADSHQQDVDHNRRQALQGLAASLALLGLPGAALAMAGKSGTGSKPDGKDIKPLVTRSALADKLAGEFHLSEVDVLQALDKAKFDPSIIERMETPYEAKPYAQYRPLFVNQRLAGLGRDYLDKHAALFAENEKRYGVEKEVIAAILGMETHYGVNKGKDSVLSALYTLASGYARRADFFRSELGNFLLLCREEHLRPEDPLGSYAGAFGTTQFIPSSFRHFAVDANGDGKRDVWDTPADIIASVGNYFHKHGWQADKPVAFWLPPTHKTVGKGLELQAQMGLRDWKTVADFADQLPALPPYWSADDKVTIVEMQTDKGRQLALVHYNFYVITRWNRSYNYAMAITELSAMLGCKLCRTTA